MLRKYRPAGLIVVALLVLAVLAPVAVYAAGGTFTDDDTSVFEADIEWMASTGITFGCNPPDNDNYCPTKAVNRGQMAAFMHRLADNQVVDAKTVQGLAPEDLRPVVYTTRKEGPTEIPGVGSFEPVASLDLPAGMYMVQAKVFFWSNSPADWWADCKLITQNVADDVWVDVATEQDNNQTAAAFIAVDEMTSDTTVTLSCRDGGGSVHARDIVIAATALSDIIGDS